MYLCISIWIVISCVPIILTSEYLTEASIMALMFGHANALCIGVFTVGRELAPHVLAPGTGRRAEVDHQMAGLDEPQRLVDLLELVGRAGAKALLLGELHVRVVHMVVQP